MGGLFPIGGGTLHQIRVFLLYPHKMAIECWKRLFKATGKPFDVIVKVRSIRPYYEERDQKTIAEELWTYRPDVIVLSDVAGGPYEIPDAGMTQLIEYHEAMPWTRWLASYAALYYCSGSLYGGSVYDNRRLCSIFGLDPTTLFSIAHRRNETDTTHSFSPVYIDSESDFTYSPTVEHQNSPLWSGIQMPALASRFKATVVPQGGWFRDGSLSCAAPGSDIRVMAKGVNDQLVILHNLTSSSSALFMSHMPD
jgi:hypothetical protein